MTAILANLVSSMLTRQIECAFEGVVTHAVAGAHKEHLDLGHGCPGCLSKVCRSRVRGYGPPTQGCLTASTEAGLKRFAGFLRRFRFPGQEHEPCAVGAGLR